MPAATEPKFEEVSAFARWFLQRLPAGIARREERRWLHTANTLRPDHLGRLRDGTPEANERLMAVGRPFLQYWTMDLDSSATDVEICAEAKGIAEANRRYWDEVRRDLALRLHWRRSCYGDDEVDAALFAGQFLAGRLKEMVAECERRGLAAADLIEGKLTTEGVARRLCDELFCRRRLRRGFGRLREMILRNHLHEVHRRKGLYVSAEGLLARRSQKRRNSALLEATRMINEMGQMFTLEELAAVSNANPVIRRNELMVRIAGFEQIARDLGHAGEFLTLTCPSAYHAVHHHGAANAKFNGATPKEAQAYLNRVWARIRAALRDEGIGVYGFRVAEPHHDGTPHWHGLFFIEPQAVRRFREIVALHGCREDARELGLKYFQTAKARRAAARAIRVKQKVWMPKAGKKVQTLGQIEEGLSLEADFWRAADYRAFHKVSARVDFKAIDWSCGSAAGYIAKYIAKNIDGKKADGETVGMDFEAEDGSNAVQTAEMVDAWAALWGIRQFQQIGGAPVTVWRELRRLRIAQTGGDESVLLRSAVAADKGDWAKFVCLMGGVAAARDVQPLALYKDDVDVPNRYGEPRAAVVVGVVEKDTGFFKVGHVHQWTRVSVCGKAAPWTGVNNCRNGEKAVSDGLNRVSGRPSERQSEDLMIKEWLFVRRFVGEDSSLPRDLDSIPPAKFEEYRKAWRAEQAADAGRPKMSAAEQVRLVAAAQAEAEAGRLKGQALREIREYWCRLLALRPMPAGIVPPEPRFDLSDLRAAKRGGYRAPVYDTPEKAAGRLRSAVADMMAYAISGGQQ